MKAIYLTVLLVIAAISIYTYATSAMKRNKTQDTIKWKKYNLRMSIANVVSGAAGISVGTLLANIVQHGW